jgi:ubiquinone/menaquinone biosynthesis C-methylase UbiE
VNTITIDEVRRCMAAHLPVYSWHRPTYQYVALGALQRLWDPAHSRALDVGGGTGVMAQTIKTLFGVRHVASVDVHDRFLPSLSIETRVYDGVTLPFADGSFDCVLLFNVLHHVEPRNRLALLRECRRVAGSGPLYIKDHLSLGAADNARLAILDFLGNTPFRGMVSASYLSEGDWRELAARTGYQCGEQLAGEYRAGLMRVLFPNRLEICMRWRPL